MPRLTALTFAVALLSPAVALAGGGDKVKWNKWDAAQKMSAASGLPIAVYAVVDQKGNGC